MTGEEIIGVGKSFCEESPKATTADLGAFAVKAGDRSLGVFRIRFADRAGEAHPITGGRDFAKGNSRLSHAVGPGVHAEEEDAFLALAEAVQVVAVAIPSVVEWIVGAGDGLGELEVAELFAEGVGGGNEWAHGPTLDGDGDDENSELLIL